MERAYRQSKYIEPNPDMLLLTCYDAMDCNFSQKGTSQVAVICMSYSDPWEKIPPQQYYETKCRMADQILNIVEKHFPGIRAHIEEIEIATPLTYMRYLGTPGGAIYGFEQFTKDTNYFVSPRSPIEGLYLAGAWAGSGGFQPTLQSGIEAGKAVIRELKNR